MKNAGQRHPGGVRKFRAHRHNTDGPTATQPFYPSVPVPRRGDDCPVTNAKYYGYIRFRRWYGKNHQLLDFFLLLVGAVMDRRIFNGVQEALPQIHSQFGVKNGPPL